MSLQDELQKAWLQGKEGGLSGREQAKAWALREGWLEEERGEYGMHAFVAGKVRKTVDGESTGDHPSRNAIRELFEKIDADDEWFRGKYSGEKRGPKRLLRGVKVTAIVSAAKRLKAEGDEPTYTNVVAACPAATLNPATGEPVDKELVYQVFKEKCYDDEDDPTDTWRHRNRLTRSALDHKAMEKRYAFALHMLALTYTPSWYFLNLVWCDLCSSILPRTLKKATDMALASKGGKSWMSECSQQKSQNLRKDKII